MVFSEVHSLYTVKLGKCYVELGKMWKEAVVFSGHLRIESLKLQI